MKNSQPVDHAIESLCGVIAQRPDFAPAYRALGATLREAGAANRAIPILRRALELEPGHFDALLGLGAALLDVDELDEAVVVLRQAAYQQPGHPVVHNLLGAALAAKDELAEALAQYRQAIQYRPGYVEAMSNLGDALRQTGSLGESLATLHQVVTRAPGYANAHNNLGMALSDLGRFVQARMCFERAIQLDADNPRYHTNLGMMLLRCGNFRDGWPHYEWRLKLKETQPRSFVQPRWRSEDLGGRRILLHAEQGFGDMIQFLRYVPQVVARGGRVVLELPPELLRLVEGSFTVERLVRLGDDPGEFDLYCPLLSLPGVFQTDLAHVPARGPYLKPPAAAAEAWHKRLAPSNGGFRVGLAWSGKPRPHGRSVPLAQLAPLAAAGNITFYSLQKQALAAVETVALPPTMRLLDCSAETVGFAELAALISHLDLVISIDTAAAHLAGAMGKPVWLLLPAPADWRWLLGRDDSPWYPSMRLFRQQRRGEWGTVIQRVAAALEDCVRRGTAPCSITT